MTLPEAQDALDMIQEAREEGLASDITITRPGLPGSYDPATNTWTEGSDPVDFSCVALVTPASQGTVEAFDVRFESGTLIESRLRALLIPALGLPFAPEPGDKVMFADGKEGVLLGCTPLAPDVTQPIVYNGTVKI